MDGGVAVKIAGVNALNSLPQYQSVRGLDVHFDAWEELYAEFGRGLDSAPDQLIVMFKDKLPLSIVTDLLDRPYIRTYEDILELCRRRTDHRKDHDLCESAKKRIMTKTRISSMPVVGEQPSEPVVQQANQAATDRFSMRDKT